MADEETFENSNWNYDLQTDDTQIVTNSFGTINIETALYQNTEYADYVTWLDGSSALALVDENTDYLTSSVLSSFQTTISEYDGWSIHVQMSYNNVSVTNQEVAFCIEETVLNTGISCAGVSTGSSSIEMTETFSYWLPVSMAGSLTGSYDLTQSDND